eukprot:CAMPEP_0170599720 /NCGR_PEP_ID=MMETSP0224-20130122/16953_1 /TAXON_ID=285029 /ORGANISM="Togula jolla, Strain CCCM 725" /LENGTH=139 /DNA_ID=CAMNT_0010924401 /DNA_START=177 /DNA_END=597 /DNA_ORIENTATION=+
MTLASSPGPWLHRDPAVLRVEAGAASTAFALVLAPPADGVGSEAIGLGWRPQGTCAMGFASRRSSTAAGGVAREPGRGRKVPSPKDVLVVLLDGDAGVCCAEASGAGASTAGLPSLLLKGLLAVGTSLACVGTSFAFSP